MAATTEQKVDFLLKKIGYVASKTGIAEDENSLSGTKKAPFAEAIPSPLVTPSTSIWADASLIPATPPGSDTSYVRVYLTGTSGVRMTVDNTVSGNRTFIARSTYGNDSSAILGDWIDTSFGADYIIKVFKGDPNSGGVQLSAAGAGSNDTWFFDYSSGVLNFNGTQIPSGVTSSNIYIVGYRYIGAKGGRPAAGIATFASLDVSGISTFRDDVNFISANGNNILFDKSDNALEFGDNVKATFGDSADLQILHTGTYSNIYNATGDLDLSSNVIRLKNANRTETFAAFINNGQAEFYYDNVKRFETTSTGAQVTGNLNVTGVLTYDDVTNIDSLGIVTARTGVDVNAGGINVDGGGLNIVGVSTFANDIIANGNIDLAGDIDVDGHTELDRLNVSGVSTYGSSANFGSHIKLLGDNREAQFGAGNDLAIKWDGSKGGVFTDEFRVKDRNNNVNMLAISKTGAFRAYHNGSNRLDTTTAGIQVFGNVVATGADINGDIDVDGHTELDNVNISGLTTAALLNVSSLTDTRVTFASASGRLVDSANLTFDGTNLTAASAKISDLTSGRVVTAGTNGALQDSANLTFNGSLLDVTGNLAVSGNVSIAGTLTYQDVTNVDSVGIATARVGIKVLAGGIEIDGGGLDVVGVSTFGNDINASGTSRFEIASMENGVLDGEISHNGDATTKIKFPSNNNISFDTNGTTRLNINNSGISVTGNIIGTGNLNVAGNIEVDDNDSIFIGTGNDVRLFHNGSASFIRSNGTGIPIRIDNHTGALNALFNPGGSTELYFNNSKKLETSSDGITIHNSNLLIQDSKRLKVGTDADLALFFNGTTSFIRTQTSSTLRIDHSATGEAMGQFIPNGAVELYFNGGKKVETTSAGITVTGSATASTFSATNNVSAGGNISITSDTGRLYLGASQDLHIFHNGSNSYIQDNGTGALLIGSNGGGVYVRGQHGEESIIANSHGSVDLYYDNTLRFQTSGIGVTVTGETKTTTLNVTGITTTNNLNVTGTATIASIGSTIGISSNFYFGDNDKIFFGDGDDLSIHHNGSGSYIQESGTGSLYIRGTNLYLTDEDGTNMLYAANNAGVNLYYGGGAKLATTVGGISVTGTTDTDNFVNAGVSTFVGIITASAVGNVIPFLFNNYSDLPAASSYHGAFAHVHTVAKGFFAHAGNWVEIVSKEADGRVGSGTETYNIKDLNITGITTIADDKKLYFGNDQDLELYYQTTGTAGAYLQTGNASGNLTIRNQDAGQYVYIHGDNVHLRSTTGNETFLQAQHNGAVSLWYDYQKKIETKIYGVDVTGTTTTDGLVVSGISTFAGGSFSGNISAVDGTFSGNVSIAGTLTYQDVTNIDSVGIVTARTDLHVGTGATVIKTVNGQVGINSTIPAHMLDVGGVINSSTDVRVNNESLVTQNQALNDAVAMAIALG